MTKASCLSPSGSRFEQMQHDEVALRSAGRGRLCKECAKRASRGRLSAHHCRRVYAGSLARCCIDRGLNLLELVRCQLPPPSGTSITSAINRFGRCTHRALNKHVRRYCGVARALTRLCLTLHESCSLSMFKPSKLLWRKGADFGSQKARGPSVHGEMCALKIENSSTLDELTTSWKRAHWLRLRSKAF